MRWPLVAPLTLLTVALAACARSEVSLEAERAALMQVSREWAAAAATGDVERIVTYWADDATCFHPISRR